jgi:hypothetical protein
VARNHRMLALRQGWIIFSICPQTYKIANCIAITIADLSSVDAF